MRLSNFREEWWQKVFSAWIHNKSFYRKFLFTINCKRFIFSSLFLFITFATCWGDNKNDFYIAVNAVKGKVTPHHENLNQLAFPYYSGEIQFGWQKPGLRQWEKAYRHSSVGLGLNYSSFTSSIIGNPISLYCFGSFPQVRRKNFILSLDLQCGLAGNFNPYDNINNPENIAIGTKYTAFFGLLLKPEFRISNKSYLSVSLGGVHYSNGAIKYPNAGLNIPAMKVGYKYFISEPRFLTPEQEIRSKHYPIHFIMSASTGFAEKEFHPSRYNMSRLDLGVLKQLSFKHRLGLLFEIDYDESNILDFQNPSEMSKNDYLLCGVKLSHEFLINKCTLLTELGLYTYNVELASKPYFERLGIRYHLTKNLFGQFSLKAHLIRADYLEFGFGCILPGRK